MDYLLKNLTYEADERSEEEITKTFNEQAKLLNRLMLIFFILMCGAVLKNLNVELKQSKNLKNHILIGIHISEGTNLPSGEKISDIKEYY